MALNPRDRLAVVLTALVSVPVAAGLLVAAVHAPSSAEVFVIGALLIVWLVTALPVAVLTGRAVPRSIPTGPNQEKAS